MNEPSLVGPPDVTSDSAIETALRRSPCMVMPWDEFGLVLQGITSRMAPPWTDTIRKALLMLYSSSRDSWHAKGRALEIDNQPPIEAPTLSVLGATTPESFYEGLAESSLKTGFLNRLLILSTDDEPIDRDATAPTTPPEALVAALLQAKADFPQAVGNLTGPAQRIAELRPSLYKVPYAADGEAAWCRIWQWQRAAIRSQADIDHVIGRAAENTIKLATLRAISNDPADPHVTEADVHWAFSIVFRSVRIVEGGVDRHLFGSPAEALRKQVLAFIVEAGDCGLPKSKLMEKRGMSADKRALDDAPQLADRIRPDRRSRHESPHRAGPRPVRLKVRRHLFEQIICYAFQ
jgi:hypothetical protein